MTIFAFDLGVHPVLISLTGAWRKPILLSACTFAAWDPDEITERLTCLRIEAQAAHSEHLVCVEQTFTWRETKKDKRRYHRDTGRQQESQAGAIEMLCHMVGLQFRRVSPVSSGEAYAAWDAAGRPVEGKGSKGEHIRDAIGVGVKGLILSEEEARYDARGLCGANPLAR